jgi:hypothetical protein
MSKVCVVTDVQAEVYRRTGELPDHRSHRHLSRGVAAKCIDAGEGTWVGNQAAIVLNPVVEPWRWDYCRSEGFVVMQMVRYGKRRSYG